VRTPIVQSLYALEKSGRVLRVPGLREGGGRNRALWLNVDATQLRGKKWDRWGQAGADPGPHLRALVEEPRYSVLRRVSAHTALGTCRSIVPERNLSENAAKRGFVRERGVCARCRKTVVITRAIADKH